MGFSSWYSEKDITVKMMDITKIPVDTLKEVVTAKWDMHAQHAEHQTPQQADFVASVEFP